MTDNNHASYGKQHFEGELDSWISEEKIGFEFIDVLGKLFYEKNIELIIFRSQLIDRSASVILHKHAYSKVTVGKSISIKDSLNLAKSIYAADVPPARIDIGRLNLEWLEEKSKYESTDDFIKDKLSHIIGAKPTFQEGRDVILYGFGRIGRLLARELIIQGNGSQLRVRAIVTRSKNPEDIAKRASLFRHDSIHGPFRGIAIENVDDQTMYINGHRVHMISAQNPEEIDYTQYGIDNALLIDNTGVFRDREALGRHLKSKGVSKVLLTAPAKGDIPNIVYGVNHDSLNIDSENIFSAASCTTNATVPTLKIIEDTFGIEKGHIETIHSYTNDQNLLDNYHSKPRRGRAAPINMVITSTGVGGAAAKAIPSLKGKLTANAVRVPTPNVSLAILSLSLKKATSLEELTDLMKDAAFTGDMVEQIRFSFSDESVSSDFIGDPVPGIFDCPSTKISEDGKNITLYVWYDNEFGYTIQVMRLAKHIAKVKRYKYY